MSTPAIPAPLPPGEPLSQPAMIGNTFIAPSKTFSALRANASWWMAWLLIAVVSYGFVYAMDKKIGFYQITKTEIDRNPKQAERMESLPPDQRDKAYETGAKVARAITYAVPVLVLLISLLEAAVLMGTFNFGLGTTVSFRVAMAIVIYGQLPYTIHALLGTIGLLAGVNPEGFNAKNPVASNPAYFMDPSVHKSIYELATTLDVFSIWAVVLMGIGFACNSKVKRSTAIIVVFCWFLFWKLISAGLAALS